MVAEACIAVATRVEAERARREARRFAATAGLDREAAACVLVATMELATNLVRYGREGIITLRLQPDARGAGVCVESVDQGPGIADVELALTDGYSTGGGLGSGLPTVLRLMDCFTLTTTTEGTWIQACKWPTSR